MKILVVGPLPPQPGGGPISRGQLLAAFAEIGLDVCVVAPITAEALIGGDRYAAEHPRVRIVRYLVPSFETQPHRPPTEEHVRIEQAAVETLVAELANSFRPDLLVAGRETLARYIPGLARRHGVPSVMLARGNPTGHILSGHYPPGDGEFLLAEFRKFNRIICVADYMTEGLRKLGCGRTTTVPNAIDARVFSRRVPDRMLRRELNIPEQSPIILVPGHINQRKRPRDVVQSAVVVLTKRPNVVYLFAGTGVLREEIERLCLEAGIAARVRFPGWIDYRRMPDVVNLADVVVMASEAEGMARSYLEAMACERTLLASDIPPARELIEDGVNGLLFRLGDVEQLAERTLDALGDAWLRAPIGRQARASIAWRTLDYVTPMYLREFRLAIEESGGTAAA